MRHEDYPALYQSASDLSQTSQSSFFIALFGHMALLTLAAAISVLNSAHAGWAVVQATTLFGALGCAIYLYYSRPDRDWYAGRAVAESIKTTAWRYLTRAEPYNKGEQQDAHNFATRLKLIIDANKQVTGKLTTHLAESQISAEMLRVRRLSINERRNYYRDFRVVDQLTWYAKKSAHNKRMVNRYFLALIITLFIAIIFALTKIKYPDANYWPTDVFVTLAAAILSWIQAKRFQELSISYSLTAHEISLIRERASDGMTEIQLSNFVGDAENAFSREHTQWIARQDAA